MRALRIAAAGISMTILLVASAPSAGARTLAVPSFLSPARNSDASPSTSAGAHPYEFFNTFTFNQSPVNGAPIGPAENVRDLSFELPPGLIAAAVRYPRCGAEAFASHSCATVSQVGVAELVRSGEAPTATVPVFNLVAPPGRAAQFGFQAPYADAHIDFRIRGGGDYGASAVLHGLSENAGLITSTLRIWGVPGDPSHDAERFTGTGAPVPGPYPEPPPFKALLSNPTACDGPLITTMEANTWQNPERPIFAAPFEAPGTAGCDQLEFSPALEAKPSTNLADSPSGLDLHLHIPQISDPEGSASAQLRSARLELPAGLAVNPAAANGLGSCTPSEIGLSIPASERQLLRYDLPPINFPGSFVVTRGGQSTPPISSTASRAEVDAALESLPGMAGNVTVGGAPGGWIVEFTGALAATDVPLLSGTVTDNPSQKIAVTAEGGTYRLETAGQSTTELPFDASASEIQAALRALPSLGLGNLYPGNVFVKSLGSEETTRLYQVVFAEDLNGAEPSLGASSSLTGTGSGVTISRLSSPSQRSLSVVSFRGNAPGTPQFDSAPANCPDTSKLGTVRVDSPEFLDHPLFGSVYLATPGENPFGSLLALYLIVEDPASDIVVKLPARVESDPSTGGLLATLAEAPQLPFEDLTIELFKGSAAPLRTPPNCGVFNVGSELTPWSAPDGARRRPQDSFAIEQGAGAGTCPSDPAAVPDLTRFSAGTLDPSAGTETPFLLKLSRPDGGRALSGIDTTLPPGLLARIAGLAPCPDSALARATSRSGTAEQSDPSCPASSRVGGLDLAAGAGPNPYNLSGAAYLAGPYRGAPVSLALITPVLAGPFDLGTVLTRVALSVDPRTTRVHAVSDPLPSSLDGLPFDLRSVSLHLGSAFARNPTSCYPLAFSGADPRQSTRFQVGDCRRLAFKPKLQIGAKGPVKAGSDPAISASLTNPGERLPANLAAADLLLPRTLRLDRRHLRSPGAVYGDVSATTPLLSEPLKGAVTLGRATSKSVQLNLALHGQFDVDLEGYLQVQKGGTLRVSFDQLPDVPLTKFTLALAGGKQGLIEATRNLCSASSSIAAELTGQNAATYDSKLALRVPCPKKGKQAKSKRGGGSR